MQEGREVERIECDGWVGCRGPVEGTPHPKCLKDIGC